jgi:hypothetical protein
VVKAYCARLAALAASILVIAISTPAAADTSGIGVIATLSGQATVARLPLPQPVPLRFKDNVFVDDRISTAERSTVRVLLGGKALVTVRELSNLTITEEVNRSTVTLNSGKIAVGVASQRMKPGETLEIRTGNAIAAVRGTVLVVEVVGANPATTNVHVLHGLVDLSPSLGQGGAPLQIGPLQSFIGTPGGFGQIRALTPEAAQALFADLHSDPQFAKGSDDFLAGLESREQERAAALAQFIGDIRGGRGGLGGGCSGADCIGANNRITPCTTGNCARPGGGSGGHSNATVKSGRALTTYNNQTIKVGGNFYTVPKAGNVNLSQPLLETTATTLTVGGSLVDVKGVLAAGDAAHPFIYLDPTTLTATGLLATTGGGSMTAATTFVQDLQGTITLSGDALSVTGNSSLSATGAAPFVALDGSTMTVAGNVFTEKAAGSTATFKGTLLEGTNGATVTAQKLVDVNAALLDASLPLLALSGNSSFTSMLNAVDLASVNAATKFASLASLNASIMTIKNGAALNLTGGSVASVTGDLFSLANKSTLTIMNGPLLSLAGGSSLNITGSLLSFIGVGNSVSITNNLCGGACPLIGGIPVFFRGGGTVSITNPVKNAAGNTITYSSPSAALVSVTGAASNLTVLGK